MFFLPSLSIRKNKIKMIDSYFENNDLYNLIIIKFV